MPTESGLRTLPETTLEVPSNSKMLSKQPSLGWPSNSRMVRFEYEVVSRLQDQLHETIKQANHMDWDRTRPSHRNETVRAQKQLQWASLLLSAMTHCQPNSELADWYVANVCFPRNPWRNPFKAHLT